MHGLFITLIMTTLSTQSPTSLRFTLPKPDFPVRAFLVTDLAANPVIAEVTAVQGAIVIEATPAMKIALHCLSPAGPAGTVMVTVDNRGEGYGPRAEAYDFLQELLYSTTGNRRPGASTDDILNEVGEALIAREEKILREARKIIRQRKSTPHRFQLLHEGDPVRNATVRVEQETTRTLLGFGAWFYEKTEWGHLTEPLFDYVTLPFYNSQICLKPGEYDWAPREASARWCRDRGIVTKGHPLVWMTDIFQVDWIDNMTNPEFKQFVHDHVHANVFHFKGLIDRWDVINEAHSWANNRKLTADELLEITDIAARAAKEANPDCMVVVNSCLPWGDYVQWNRDRTAMTPYEYYSRLIRRGTPFDVIGLQLYNAYTSPFPHRDLAAMSEILDRYSRLGMEIHVTEFAVPSATGEYGVWHGKEWTPELQAEYSRGFYEIAASKPYIKAITWWSPLDGPREWAHVGLVDKNVQAKPVLNELIKMKCSWMTSTRTKTGDDGFLEFKGMAGRYRFTWKDVSGQEISQSITIGE